MFFHASDRKPAIHSRRTVTALRRLFLLLLPCVVAACVSTPQSDRLLLHPPAPLVDAKVLHDVAFFPQKKYQCGPASLAALLSATGLDVTPGQLQPWVYVPRRKGSFQGEMLGTTRRFGRIPYVLHPELEHLLLEIHAGRPVLVLQNLGLKAKPVWHYAVAVGFDLDKGELILHSGTRRFHRVSLPLFERTWQRAGHWAFVAVNPSDIPVTAQPINYIKTVRDLEKTGLRQPAFEAYRRASKRWPADKVVLMALANAAYDRDNLALAETTLRKVVMLDDSYAPALNNLAQVLLEQEKWDEAMHFAEKALTRHDAHHEIYRKTLQAIQARRMP